MDRNAQTLFSLEDSAPFNLRNDLGQYYTPRWVAEFLVNRFYPDLDASHHVLDPSAGTGSWLHAIPSHVAATGVEIDPNPAAITAEDTGRRIIIGDFTNVALDFEPTHILGNPPFATSLIAAFCARSRKLLPPNGRIGWILPAYALSFARTTLDMLRGFECEVDLLPRDLFPRISHPLIFARLTKNSQQRLIGFLLFEEALAVRQMRANYRAILNAGRTPIWKDVLFCALRACGGQASLQQLYRVIDGYRPTTSTFWRDILRRVAAEYAVRVSDGVFRLPSAA